MVSQSELLSYVDGVGVANLQLSFYYYIMYARKVECLRGRSKCAGFVIGI